MSVVTGRIRSVVVGALVAVLVSGSLFYLVERRWSGGTQEPLFADLGHYHRPVTTRSATAQKYFDQGLAFLYGFDYEEAIGSFEAAAASDPDCAMAYWGLAMANAGKVDDAEAYFSRAVAAWNASRRAVELANQASPVEQALFKAVSKRFDMPPPLDRGRLDRAYASAMRDAWVAFPDDPDVGALVAEAAVLTRTSDVCLAPGQPLPPSDEVVRTLQTVLKKHPGHPYALHLLIHALESSDRFELARNAADRLRDMAPGLSHLSHMPTHIDIRRGNWQQALVAAEKAVAADEVFRHMGRDPGYYRALVLHNEHMLAYVAAMRGQGQKASAAVKELLANIPEDYLSRDVERVDFYFALPYQLHIRFGQWQEMLEEAKPRADLRVATAMWHLGRAHAHLAKGDRDQTKSDWTAFLTVAQALPAEVRIRSNAARSILMIASITLGGEILYCQGKIDEAIAQLREAVRGEDSLSYIEPPEFVQPARHVLGAMLLDAGRYAEAQAVYEKDLALRPENGWSLFGLARCLEKQGKPDAAPVRARFQAAWKDADTRLNSSWLGGGLEAGSLKPAPSGRP